MPADADLLAQLAQFSERALRKLSLPVAGSPHGQAALPGPVKGVVLHYTADPAFKSVLRWFCDPSSLSSAHLVVSRQREEWAAGLDDDLPLVKALPVTVVQLRRPDQGAYHATWANSWAWGIEICNTGEIRERSTGEGYLWWPKNWTTPYTCTAAPWGMGGRLWEAYPYDQVAAVVALCRAYLQRSRALPGGGIVPARVIGHENVQGLATVGCGNHDKRDMGPAWPAWGARQAIFAPDPTTLTAALASCRVWCNSVGMAQSIQQQLLSAQIGARAGAANLTQQGVVDIARRGVLDENDRVLRKLMLTALGYYVEPGAAFQPQDVESVRLLQRLCGLKDDGICGPKTDQALCARLVDRNSGAPPLAVA